ncbi:glutamyl-tRNA reductase [Nocardioides oleivorans]|uniref:Glutamyl-tRNA reductase n=1 Tax=Nocardioides oleivorans TaxID=273676 RepID=A0A4Q2RX41_9ACTN|nr:glutamyl-tRNA reductase [Nocardioides oleivorans]RYB93578.1 glutamyl-tRNA reductase [Nocardioides oleivorans]
MSVLVVGISHKSAPVGLLEKLALDPDGAIKLVGDVVAGEHVTEATAIVTCNRLEVYAEVDRFHGSVEDVSGLLVARAEQPTEAMLRHLYVHYDEGAVSHLFQVAAGLDSMVVGEGQILGQTRDALRIGQEHGTVGPALNTLFQQALRVGKRAHAETDIDRAAPSLVSTALERSATPVAGARAVVIGAGAMASLAVAHLSRGGAASISVLNRTAARAERLAHEYGATSLPLERLVDELATADIVVSCTGAPEPLVRLADVVTARGGSDRPVTVIDLALPHDVDPKLAELPGVELINLTGLADALRGLEATAGVDDVRTIVGQEIAAFLAVRRQASVTPTVVALRSMATAVVDAEMERLAARMPDLDEATRAEVLHTVRRVADKLLHEPTVRVKELADAEPAVSYTAALAELFRLDPQAVDRVTRAEGKS